DGGLPCADQFRERPPSSARPAGHRAVDAPCRAGDRHGRPGRAPRPARGLRAVGRERAGPGVPLPRQPRHQPAASRSRQLRVPPRLPLRGRGVPDGVGAVLGAAGGVGARRGPRRRRPVRPGGRPRELLHPAGPPRSPLAVDRAHDLGRLHDHLAVPPAGGPASAGLAGRRTPPAVGRRRGARARPRGDAAAHPVVGALAATVQVL
ncbi:MAG: putative membrane protein, partial [uncultured Blastococcus sp.]